METSTSCKRKQMLNKELKNDKNDAVGTKETLQIPLQYLNKNIIVLK